MTAKSWVPDRLKDVVKAAEAAGWTYDRTKRDHPRLTPPKGTLRPGGDRQGPITFASSPSDIRGDRNGRARLRRAGVDI